ENLSQVTAQHQKELDQLNYMLVNALEPYEREFSRQGIYRKAEEIHKLRAALNGIYLETKARVKATEIISSSLSADPNQYPFAYEGPGYKEVRGIIPRSCMIELNPEISGWVNETPF